MTAETQDNGFRVSRRKMILGSIVGALVAANAGVLAWRGGVFKVKNRSKPLELSFDGPFSYGQRVTQSPIANSWVELKQVAISDQDSRCLHVSYQLKGATSPQRKVRIAVSATTADGKTYKLAEGERDDMRSIRSAWGGSRVMHFSPVNSESLFLPAKPNDIAKLCLRLENIEPSSPAGSEL